MTFQSVSSKTWRRLVAAAALSSLLVSVGPAAAEEQLGEQAKRRFLVGKAQYKSGDYAGALASFNEVLRRVWRSSVLLMAAHCYRRLAQPDKALARYQEYLSASRRETGAQIPPHSAVVERHIAALRRTLAEVKRGELLMEGGDPRAALAIFEAERQQLVWPRLLTVLARCYRQLEHHGKALQAIRVAIEQWEQYSAVWKADTRAQAAPEHLEVRYQIEQLRRLERTIQQRLADSIAVRVPPRPRPGDGRNRLWLASALGTATLVAGFEALAWVSFVKGNDVFINDPALERFRTMTLAGHVLAGAMAVASVVSFLLYYRSGQQPDSRRASPIILPGPGGFTVGGSIPF